MRPSQRRIQYRQPGLQGVQQGGGAFPAHKKQMIHVIFGSLDENSKVRQKATEAKMARGEMIRYLAEIQAEKAEDLKGLPG